MQNIQIITIAMEYNNYFYVKTHKIKNNYKHTISFSCAIYNVLNLSLTPKIEHNNNNGEY